MLDVGLWTFLGSWQMAAGGFTSRTTPSCSYDWECQDPKTGGRPWMRCDHDQRCVCAWPCSSRSCAFLNHDDAIVRCPKDSVHVRSHEICSAAMGKGYTHCCMPAPPSSTLQHWMDKREIDEQDWIHDHYVLRVMEPMPCPFLHNGTWVCFHHEQASLVALTSSTLVQHGGHQWAHITPTTHVRITFPITAYHERLKLLEPHCLFEIPQSRSWSGAGPSWRKTSRAGFQTTGALCQEFRCSEHVAYRTGFTVRVEPDGQQWWFGSKNKSLSEILTIVRQEELPAIRFFDEQGWYASNLEHDNPVSWLWHHPTHNRAQHNYEHRVSIVCWQQPQAMLQSRRIAAVNPLLSRPTVVSDDETRCPIQSNEPRILTTTVRSNVRDILLRHIICGGDGTSTRES